MTLNEYCIGMFILFQNIKLETEPTLKVQPLIDLAVCDVIINYCNSSLGIRHSTPGVKPQFLVNSLWDKGSRPKNVGKVMTNFGPWKFIFRWLLLCLLWVSTSKLHQDLSCWIGTLHNCTHYAYVHCNWLNSLH